MDKLDQLDDASAAAAFRRLVRLLRHREDAQNIEHLPRRRFAGWCVCSGTARMRRIST